MSDYYGKDRQEKEQKTGTSGQEPWWNNVSQYMPKPVRPEPAPAPASQGGYDNEDSGLSPVVIVTIVFAVVAVLVVGGCAAAYAFSHQAQNQSTEITQADEDAAKKASDVYLTVYADGADAANCSPATVSVLKGTEGDEVVRSVNVKPGERADLGMLDAGQYRIHVDTVPTNPDGSTYLSPLFDIQFEVAGDGEDMELTCNLDPATSGDDASNQERKTAISRLPMQRQMPTPRAVAMRQALRRVRAFPAAPVGTPRSLRDTSTTGLRRPRRCTMMRFTGP